MNFTENELKAQIDLAQNIKVYRNLSNLDGDTLCTLLQQITGILYYLEGVRSSYHRKWQETANKYVLEGSSFNQASNKAELDVPELYELRRKMDAAYEVVNAIRTQISWIKSEKQTI